MEIYILKESYNYIKNIKDKRLYDVYNKEMSTAIQIYTNMHSKSTPLSN